jgi:hypothetical protein
MELRNGWSTIIDDRQEMAIYFHGCNFWNPTMSGVRSNFIEICTTNPLTKDATFEFLDTVIDWPAYNLGVPYMFNLNNCNPWSNVTFSNVSVVAGMGGSDETDMIALGTGAVIVPIVGCSFKTCKDLGNGSLLVGSFGYICEQCL